MKAVKTIVNLQSINRNTINKPLLEFYCSEDPTKEFIKEKTEEVLAIKLETRAYSPDEGGDFGAFFFSGDMYAPYGFKDIEILEL